MVECRHGKNRGFPDVAETRIIPIVEQASSLRGAPQKSLGWRLFFPGVFREGGVCWPDL